MADDKANVSPNIMQFVADQRARCYEFRSRLDRELGQLRSNRRQGAEDLRGALEKLQKHQKLDAIDAFKKADKQDGHHCAACQQQLVSLGLDTGDYKLVIESSPEMLSDAKTPVATATGHAYRGLGEVREGCVPQEALFPPRPTRISRQRWRESEQWNGVVCRWPGPR